MEQPVSVLSQVWNAVSGGAFRCRNRNGVADPAVECGRLSGHLTRWHEPVAAFTLRNRLASALWRKPLQWRESRAVSSAGRAPRLHRGGRRFEPVTAHSNPPTWAYLAWVGGSARWTRATGSRHRPRISAISGSLCYWRQGVSVREFVMTWPSRRVGVFALAVLAGIGVGMLVLRRTRRTRGGALL